MELDFRALLANDGTLSALVSARIYPATYPQNAVGPAVRYAKVTGAPGLHMQGSDGLNFDLMQVDIRYAVAPTENSVINLLAIRDAVLAVLNAYSGTQGTTQFQLIALRDDRGPKFETNGAAQFFTHSLDFDTTWRAA